MGRVYIVGNNRYREITHLIVQSIGLTTTGVVPDTLVSTEHISWVTHTPLRTGAITLPWRRLDTGRLAG